MSVPGVAGYQAVEGLRNVRKQQKVVKYPSGSVCDAEAIAQMLRVAISSFLYLYMRVSTLDASLFITCAQTRWLVSQCGSGGADINQSIAKLQSDPERIRHKMTDS